MQVKQLIKAIVPRPLWEWMRQMQISRYVRNFKPYVVEHRYGTEQFKISVGDGLARGWYDHDWSEPPEIALLTEGLLKAGASVFDLGAHQGIVAMMLAKKIGSDGSFRCRRDAS